MSKKFQPHNIQPDPIYESILVAKFINQIMQRGKKTIAQKIVYGAFDILKEKTKQEPLEIFEKAISIISPKMEVRPQRVGGATYQVPREVKEKRAAALAFRWLIEVAEKKKGSPMKNRLAEEMLQAVKGEGEAVKKKTNIHKMAEANRAFAYLAR